jgi:hypothetical protein
MRHWTRSGMDSRLLVAFVVDAYSYCLLIYFLIIVKMKMYIYVLPIRHFSKLKPSGQETSPVYEWQPSMTLHRCATCALMEESTTRLVSHCDAIVRAEAQMPDLSTSHVLLNMQKLKASRLL